MNRCTVLGKKWVGTCVLSLREMGECVVSVTCCYSWEVKSVFVSSQRWELSEWVSQDWK